MFQEENINSQEMMRFVVPTSTQSDTYNFIESEHWSPFEISPVKTAMANQFLIEKLAFGYLSHREISFDEMRQNIPLVKNNSNHVPDLKEFEEVLDKSRNILALQDDFDEEGSVHYAENTYKRAVEFVRKLWKFSVENLISIPSLPKILPGPNGSIDVYLDSKSLSFLANIPNSLEKNITYYGRRKDNNRNIKGEFSEERVSDIVVFLNSD